MDVLADGDALDLIELNLAAHRDLLVAIAHPRQDHADRLRAVLAVLAHRANLPRRGVRPQDHARRGRVEGVPHIAGGVVRRDVEQREVGLVVLDVAAAVDLKAHLRPDVVELAQHLRGRMQPADRTRATGQRHVDLAAFEVARQFLRLDQRFALGEGLRQRDLDLVGALAEVRRVPLWAARRRRA